MVLEGWETSEDGCVGLACWLTCQPVHATPAERVAVLAREPAVCHKPGRHKQADLLLGDIYRRGTGMEGCAFALSSKHMLCVSVCGCSSGIACHVIARGRA